MAKVEIYRRDFCGFCAAAEGLLRKKGVQFTAIDIWKNPDRKAEMVKRAGGKTSVPQIFIDGKHVGGCDDLMASERSGQLSALLG